MKHDHASFGIGHNAPGCRLCGCTDRKGLIEDLAEKLWLSRQIDDFVAWADAGELWRLKFRELF